MNKKTVSILILIIFTLAVALFSFSSCKLEPKLEPTPAPEPGAVPQIPNEATTLSKVTDTEMKSITGLIETVGRFFADYSETYEDEIEGLQDSTDISLKNEISISAPDGEGTFRTKDFTYSDLTGRIDYVPRDKNNPNSTKSVFLIVEGKVTSELFGEGEHTIRMENDLMEDNGYLFYLDGSETQSFAIEPIPYNGNHKYYDGKNQIITTEENYAEHKAAVKEKIDLLMYIGYKALSKATVDLSGVILSLSNGEDNVLEVALDGQILLSGEYRETIKEDIDFFDDAVADLFTTFTATASDLSVTAQVSTKTVVAEEALTETLSATIDIKNLSLSTAYAATTKDDEVTSFSFDKLIITAWNSDDYLSLSFEASDFNLSLIKTADDDTLVEVSTTLGLGLLIDEESVGLVADFEMTTGAFSGIPYFTFIPRALAIDGAYYDPQAVKRFMLEQIDELAAALKRRFRRAYA